MSDKKLKACRHCGIEDRMMCDCSLPSRFTSNPETCPTPTAEKADVVEARSALEAVMTAIRTVDPWCDGEGETLSMNASPQGVENIALRAIKAYEQFAALQSRPAEPGCDNCHGQGEVFGHADDCDNDSCALNGDMDSCQGKVEPCHCSATAEPAGEEPVAWMRVNRKDGQVVLSQYRMGDLPFNHERWVETPLYARQAPSNPDRLLEALRDFGTDYMTSEAHHPGYVLIPTEQFDRIRAALSAPALDGEKGE